MMKFEPTLHKLSNGITILLDPMDIETVNMKIYIKGGSRIENPKEYGISHFLEHMLFVGTEKFPTRQKANDFLQDNGGIRNGSTGILSTSYHGRILAENFPVLIDMLSDMFFNSKFEQEKIDTERGVISQEIKRSRDDEVRKFNNVVRRNIFAGSYLEKYDNMGTDDTIKSFDRKDFINYKDAKYNANNIIIGISGKSIDTEEVLKELEKMFGVIKKSQDIYVDKPIINPSIIYDEREDKKQTKIFIGFEDIYTYERKYDYENMCVSVFKSALARRLAEEIRKQGLVYSFGLECYGDTYAAVSGFVTALSPDKLDKVISIIANGCHDILHKNHITQEELNRKKTMTKLAMADFFESSTSRSDRLIEFYSDYKELYNPIEFEAMRDKMTVEDVMKYSADVFSKPLNIIAQGPKCDIDMKSIWEENFK